MYAKIDITALRKQLCDVDVLLKTGKTLIATKHNKPAFALVDLQYLEGLLQTIDILKNPKAHEFKT